MRREHSLSDGYRAVASKRLRDSAGRAAGRRAASPVVIIAVLSPPDDWYFGNVARLRDDRRTRRGQRVRVGVGTAPDDAGRYTYIISSRSADRPRRLKIHAARVYRRIRAVNRTLQELIRRRADWQGE